jgi:hypothetical protein
MNKRALVIGGVVLAALALLGLLCAVMLPAGTALPAKATGLGRLPRIRPDYSQIVIPPNIAPLNFLIEEPGSEFRVRLHGLAGGEILLGSREPGVVIPPRPWRELLEQNRGTNIVIDVFVKGSDGVWIRFEPVRNTVAPEPIDSHLVYRLLGPVCNRFCDLGIYQRNLENFDESPILQNGAIGNGCINCHSFQNNRPESFSFHVRPGTDKTRTAAGMVLVRGNRGQWLQTKSAAAPRPPGYLCWHPTAPTVAFAMIKPSLLIRSGGAEVRDEFDFRSDLAVMNVDTCAASSPPIVAAPDRLETFPCWSANGKILYYSSAKTLWGAGVAPNPELVARTRFDLMRVAFDVTNGTWGAPEVVLAAADTGKSIVQPRASPDGRYLLLCMTDYGAFPVYQSGSDLHLINLQNGQTRRMECNSDQADSWHCWSANSRWIVFSSKRDNGLLARPYVCYLDAQGREHKPFVLPQKDPAFYDSFLRTYNVPELVGGPVTVTPEELSRAVLSGFAAAHQAQPADQNRSPLRQ